MCIFFCQYFYSNNRQKKPYFLNTVKVIIVYLRCSYSIDCCYLPAMYVLYSVHTVEYLTLPIAKVRSSFAVDEKSYIRTYTAFIIFITGWNNE